MVGSCAQIAEKPENAAEQLASSGLLQAVEDVSDRQILSLDDITRAVPSGCVPEVQFYINTEKLSEVPKYTIRTGS